MNDIERLPMSTILWVAGNETCMIGVHGPVVVEGWQERHEILDEIDSLVSSLPPDEATRVTLNI